MNLVLERLADNAIIDELVEWPPRVQKIRRIRACLPIFRKPFIEIETADTQISIRHFGKEDFARDWAEACVILQTLSDIELVSDFDFQAWRDADELAGRVLALREQCINESYGLFEQGMFEQFVFQYGEDCRDLPAEVLSRLAEARQALGKQE